MLVGTDKFICRLGDGSGGHGVSDKDDDRTWSELVLSAEGASILSTEKGSWLLAWVEEISSGGFSTDRTCFFFSAMETMFVGADKFICHLRGDDDGNDKDDDGM